MPMDIVHLLQRITSINLYPNYRRQNLLSHVIKTNPILWEIDLIGRPVHTTQYATKYSIAGNCCCSYLWLPIGKRRFVRSSPRHDGHRNNYTVSQKNMPPKFCLYIHQILTDVKNSFTDILCGKFAVTQLLNIPPHLYCIATLPCEI